jgi:hypothetical protein
MGIDVELQDERGSTLARVGDPGSVLVQVLPDENDASFVCLRFIDPYGDTTFNQHQVRVLIGELERVKQSASVKARAFLDEVEQVAHRGRASRYFRAAPVLEVHR